MASYLGVVPHPWFAVTDDQGAFSLDGVPPGTYTVEIWHEIFGRTELEAVVSPGDDVHLNVTMQSK